MNTILKPLTQLSEILSGGTPSKKIPEYWDGDIPWISAKTMKTSRVSTSNLHISKAGLERGSKIAPKGSVLILTRGSELFNRVPICFVERDVAFNQDVKCIIPHKNLDGEFLYYFLTSIHDHLLKSIGVTGIGAGKLETNVIENILVPCFPIEMQKELVKFISIYDKKIIKNQNESAIMQEILNALFEHWFLNHNYGVSNVLDNILEVKIKNKNEENYPVLSVVKEGEFKASEDVFTKQVYSKSTKNYKIVRRNQVAYNPARANIGSIAMLKECAIGLVSPIYIVFEMKDTITPTFFYYYMKQPIFQEMIKHHAIGTTRQNFPFEAFKMFPMVVPPMEHQLKFEEIAKPIEQKIAKLKEENEVLAEIRDTLLPKLMSGELPVEVDEE